mmetsp:Transcript_16694/g.51994  ORF Transcript_16694/g.51994 Transcript_16694/m.51994 type:complete len:491 (-) Transcript_16694:14-1486(-)
MSSIRKHAFRAVVDALKARGKTVAVVESTCGGLIQSSIQAVEGSSSVYYGGSVAYNTKRCKPILLNDEKLHASLTGANAADAASYKASKLDWTAKTASAYLDAMGTDYAVAEGGAAGPTFRPEGLETGFAAVAVAARGADGAVEIVRSTLVESAHAKREANMELFATSAARELLAAATANEGLDRRSQDRDDEAAVAAYKARPDCRYVVCDGGRALFSSETALALIDEAEALAFGIDDQSSGTTIAFLGLAGGAPLFAVNARAGLDDSRFRDTRTQAPFLSPTENQVALAATAIATWHRRSGFCSVDGGPAILQSAGHARKGSTSGALTFPRSDPAAIMAVSSRCNSKILLARSPRHPAGMMTTLAGFCEAGETLESAVAREVLEETGVVVDEGSVRYLKSQPWPFPQSCMLAFRATADASQPLVLDDELLEAKWWDRDSIRRACEVPGAVMRAEVAAAAFAADPTLEVLVPPKNVVARELIEAWLNEDD